MCIIVAKPKNVDFPTWGVLHNCFDYNSDGAGIMWNGADGMVHIEKGFMNWKSFKARVKQLKKEWTDDTAVVMHFRIKTHGEVSRECCHPFALSDNLNVLRKTRTVTKYGVAHNGILMNMNTNSKKSDTMDYIMRYLYPIMQISPDIMRDKMTHKLIENTLETCRLAILDGKGNIATFGTWVQDGGLFFSNTTYRNHYGYGYGYGAYGYYGGCYDTASTKSSYPAASRGSNYYDDFDWEYDETPDDKGVSDVLAPMPRYKVCSDCLDFNDCACNGCVCSDEREAEQWVGEQEFYKMIMTSEQDV